jgi:hypothetical protein
MLGNDQWGDCVAVTAANRTRQVTGTLTTEVYPNLQQVLDLYKTQNPDFPNQDNGMVIQDCLDYLLKTGWPDGDKIVAYAQVNFKNLEEVKAAIAIFGNLWIGIWVQQANETQFNRGQVWDYIPNSPILGGHSVLAGEYHGISTDDIRFITWAKQTGFTDNFWQNMVEEVWIVVSKEHLGNAQFLEGVDVTKLAQAYKDITGRELPVIPTPPPLPKGCLGALGRTISGNTLWVG